MQYKIGIISKLGKQIVESFRIDEVLTDLTFKSNNKSLELIALIVSCMDVGFLLSKFLLEPGAKDAYKSREESLSILLQSLKDKLPNFKLFFFSTDKESSHIQSIYKIFCLMSSLCIWPMNRAVKQKMKSLLRVARCYFNNSQETSPLSLIGAHNSRSVLTCSQTPAELHDIAVGELREFFYILMSPPCSHKRWKIGTVKECGCYGVEVVTRKSYCVGPL